MQQPQLNYAESPEFLSIKNGQQVSSYRDSLSLLYINPKTVHLARNRWKVAEIKTYKDMSTKAKHDFRRVGVSAVKRRKVLGDSI